MTDDEDSLSFASSIEIANIKDQYLSQSGLYKDLDQLEKSIEAEFKEFTNQARTFPFHELNHQENHSSQKKNEGQLHQELDNMSIHSDHDILGDDLMERMERPSDSSWRHYLNNEQVDDNYKVQPLRNNKSSSPTQSRNVSPGEYFGARSLPLQSIYDILKYQSSESDHIEQKDTSVYKKNHLRELLDMRFKRLPDSIQSVQIPNRMRDNSVYVGQCWIEPREITFNSELTSKISIINDNTQNRQSFSLFSSSHYIDCERTEGVILEDETIDIKIKLNTHLIRHSNIDTLFIHDKLLVVINHQSMTEISVRIDFTLEHKKRPECTYCAIEQGYPYHDIS
ncbi:hypothetical protein BDB01DRAFT_907627 [Pilobolus umbonatus]|nr:hypothetical protein BDB01DRAFT_907627 [Pilobolus umbonatus]